MIQLSKQDLFATLRQFPSLKYLNLTGIPYMDYQDVELILSLCPNLKEFYFTATQVKVHKAEWRKVFTDKYGKVEFSKEYQQHMNDL